MRVIPQLLKEFWLPLLLGAAWTAFNFFDRPGASWTVREVLNVFGPTFFFMSWLVAQWYRVRKQQRVEEGLSEIHAGVKAIQAPLLPCGLFITLEMIGSDEDVKRIFGEHPGFRSFGPDRPMPDPPMGLPPGQKDARLFRPGGYLDYRDGVVTAAGFFRLEHPGYNSIHCEISHTVCELDGKALEDSKLKNSPFGGLPSVLIELFLKGRPSSKGVKPSLVLKGSSTAISVFAAYGLDNHVFVDLGMRSLAPEPVSGPSWSSADLEGAFIKASFNFFYIDGIWHVPKEGWPRLHNFQLWLGGSGTQLLTFSSAQLESQSTRENPEPLAVGATCPQIVFEYELEPAAFGSSLQSGT